MGQRVSGRRVIPAARQGSTSSQDVACVRQRSPVLPGLARGAPADAVTVSSYLVPAVTFFVLSYAFLDPKSPLKTQHLFREQRKQEDTSVRSSSDECGKSKPKPRAQ
jgi:hypothetical protein